MIVLLLNVAQKPCHSSTLAVKRSIYEYTTNFSCILFHYCIIAIQQEWDASP